MLVAAVLLASAALGAAPASGAERVLTTSSTTVAVGGTVDAIAGDCRGGDDFSYRHPEIWLITGSGTDAVVATIGGAQLGDSGRRLEVPGWVDPDQPAVVAARCLLDTQGPVDGRWTTTTTVLWTYDEVPIDVTPASGPTPSITATADRTTAAQGQVITVVGSGCPPGGIAALELFGEADMSGRSGLTPLTGEEPGVYRVADSAGAFTVKLALNANLGLPGVPLPVPEGPHWMGISCSHAAGPDGPAATTSGRPFRVVVTGTNPTDSHRISLLPDGTVRVSGAGCTGGRTVDLALDGAVGGAPPVAKHKIVTPAADGSWSVDIVGDRTYVTLDSDATCGDPTAGGFAYVHRLETTTGDSSIGLALDAATAAPGATVTASLTGSCNRPVVVEVRSGDQVVGRSDAVWVEQREEAGPATVELAAPTTPGTYEVAAPCGWTETRTVTLVVSQPGVPGGPPPAVPVPGTASYTG